MMAQIATLWRWCWCWCLALVVLLEVAQCWVQDGEAKLNITLPTKQFLGNESARDFFRLLDKDSNTILIGARNVVYNLTISDLKAKKQIEWHSPVPHREMCMLKGKSSDVDCQNYIRVSVRDKDGKMLICGTNSYKPRCRHYHTSGATNRLEMFEEIDGTALCPFNPEHNSTAIYAHGHLYTATVADFSSNDPLIYRRSQRTEVSDQRQLNNPSFVSAMSYKDFVYFFFRETSVEYMNCGKAIYSRVARVCTNDKGGPGQFREKWTSFLKARLNCSIQGEYPFYFDEIQSTSEVIKGIYGDDESENDIIYGVLTTPVNSIAGSAVCAFSMRDIQQVFEGEFKGQETINSNWLPVEGAKIPRQRPGVCVNDSRTLPDDAVNFIKTHPLMEQAVPSFLSKPLIVKVSSEYRFTTVAVYPQVLSSNGRKYDVLYVGTDNGKVIKVLNAASGQTNFDYTTNEENRAPVDTIVVSEQQVLRPGVPVIQMHVSIAQERLIVIGNEVIKSVSLNLCVNITKCSQCITIRDPHCAWNRDMQTCEWIGTAGKLNANVHYQDVEGKGNLDVCDSSSTHIVKSEDIAPRLHGKLDVTVKDVSLNEVDIDDDLSNDIPTEISISPEEKQKFVPGPFKINKSENMEYTAQALHIAVAASCLVTLLLGFVVGYLFSRRFRHPFFSDTNPFHEQHNHLNRLPPLETPLNVNSTTYLPPRANKTINLVVNVPMKQDNLQHELGGKDRTHECKNSNESLDKDIKCGTLQKVKKTYI